MVTVGLYYDVFPEKDTLFTEKCAEVIAALGRAAGHRASYLYRRVDDPYSYAIISEWDDESAFREFLRSDAFRRVTAWGREQVLRGAPRHKIYPRSEDLARPPAAP